MTNRAVYVIKVGTKRIKKVNLQKLIYNLNLEFFNKKFFATKKEAKEHIKNGR